MTLPKPVSEPDNPFLRRILWTLCSFNIFVCLSSFGAYLISHPLSVQNLEGKVLARLYRFSGVNVESSLPTWYTSSLWLMMAVVSLMIAVLGRNKPVFWRGGLLLAAVSLSASLDEIAQVHESLALFGQLALGSIQSNIPVLAHFLWVVPGLIVSTLVGLSLVNFIRQLPSKAARGIVASAAIFLTGALGMEILSGLWAYRFGENIYYQLLVTIEEGMEMTGITVALVSLLSVIRFRPQSEGVHLGINLK
ncbi:hypothetical protein [Neisseria sp. CCUG12390]|uniref:hypothetical protein n=1 Tax=Neisseria sp. CCUG12390 TaxID=3392035 RepID=UPI003A0FE642